MYRGIKTSLISLICGAAVSTGAFAAPTVRTLGGTGTYVSSAAATSSRAGSLRSTGATGGLRPSVSISGTSGTDANDTTTATGTSVSSGTTSVGRVASSPRLSIGKYIGAPKSVSTTPSGGDSSDLLARIEKLESDVSNLETTKQNLMSGSDYIYIEDNEIVLDFEKLKADLELGTGTDGREIEMGTNDEDGILWRYVGDTEWNILITWDAIRDKLGLGAINQEIADLTDALNRKLDKQYDVSSATGDPTLVNKALVVDNNGNIQPLGEFVNIDQGAQNEGQILVVGDGGRVTLGERTGVTNQDLADLGLRELAYRNTVDTAHIDDTAVARAKLANDIASVISWIEWWKTNAPGDVTIDPTTGKMTGDGMQYVLSVDANGNARWFRVITAADGTTGGTGPSEPGSETAPIDETGSRL